MTEIESRRSDEEIIEESIEIEENNTPPFLLPTTLAFHVALRAAPELRKQANLKLLNEIKNEVKERFQDRTRLGETAANHEDRLADAAYLNALSGLWDWLEAKRRELEK